MYTLDSGSLDPIIQPIAIGERCTINQMLVSVRSETYCMIVERRATPHAKSPERTRRGDDGLEWVLGFGDERHRQLRLVVCVV